MDHRSNLQLRLQQAVNGLSVAAITYYVAALLHYELEAVHPMMLVVDPAAALAVAIPFFFLAIRRVIRSKKASYHPDFENSQQH